MWKLSRQKTEGNRIMKSHVLTFLGVFSLFAIADASAVEMPIGCVETKLMAPHGQVYFSQQELKRLGRQYQGIVKVRSCRASDIRTSIKGQELYYADQCSSNSSTNNCRSSLRLKKKFTDILNNLN